MNNKRIIVETECDVPSNYDENDINEELTKLYGKVHSWRIDWKSSARYDYQGTKPPITAKPIDKA